MSKHSLKNRSIQLNRDLSKDIRYDPISENPTPIVKTKSAEGDDESRHVDFTHGDMTDAIAEEEDIVKTNASLHSIANQIVCGPMDLRQSSRSDMEEDALLSGANARTIDKRLPS